MKKAGRILLLFWLSLTHLLGQTAHLEGTVVDRTSLAPLAFSTIAVYRATDSTLVNGILADSAGKFRVTQLEAGSYYLTVAFLGYEKHRTPAFALTNGQALRLSPIALTATQRLLQEIQVSGQKAADFHQIDRQVYRSGQFQTAVGGTAIDVLKNLPSVTVDGQGDISVRGSSGFLVLLNGKPVQGDAATLLGQLPANGIENIEIMTTPSARYDTDGKAGLINIITKTGVDQGLVVLVNALGGLPSVHDFDNKQPPHRYSTDVTLNYKKAKWDVSLGASYNRNDLAGRRVGAVNTTIGNRFTAFPSDGERSTRRKAHSIRATVGYSPTQNDVFQVGLYRGARTDDRVADLFYRNTTTDLTTGRLINRINYYNANLVRKQGQFSIANAEYTHRFSAQSTLSISGLYEHDQLSGFTRNLNLARAESTDTLQYTLNTNQRPLTGYRFRADYARRLGKGRLEVGYQYRSLRDRGHFVYLQKERSGDPLIYYPAFSGRVSVNNRIQSVYGQYAGTASRKLSYLAGLRYEYANRQLTIGDPSTVRKLTLRNLFPSANLQYQFTEQWQARAGYSRRVQRSTSPELNPLPEREHSETLEQGDPNLLPEFVSLAEAGLVRSGKTGSLFATLYYQGITNVVNRVNSVYADTILNRLYTNAGKGRRLGIEVGLDLKPKAWWKLYLGGNLYDYRIKGSLFNQTVPVNNGGLVYSINVNSTFQLARTWSLQGSLNYLSQRATAQGEDSRFVNPGATLKKTFLAGRLSAMLQWQSMDLGWLRSNEQRITTRGRDFYTTTNYIYEKDVFLISLSYTLNQRGRKVKFTESEFGDKEF